MTERLGGRRRVLLLGVLGLLTCVLGLAAGLAPVTAQDPVVSWPKAGEAPASTVVPLSPYRPLALTATVPCATLSALDVRGGGEALRTLPADVDPQQGTGLVVAAADRTVTITSSGRQLVSEPISPGCSYTVTAGADGTQVLRDGTLLVADPDLLTPQVAEFETAAEGLPEAAGLAVALHTDARYESSPSTLKTVLLVLQGIALLALLVVAWRTWPGRRTRIGKVRPSPADAVVLVVTLGWAILGPVNIDDSWYALMARNGAASGSLGNYIYQFDVTENPFSLSQYPMQWWGSVAGWGLLSLRVLPVLYGLVTYVLLRVLLKAALGRIAERPGVPWALAVAHLVWFCAYGITLRPETVIVVCAAATLLLAEIARQRESLGVLAAATAVASLAMMVSPTALIAVAPLLVCLPFLWRWLRGTGWAERIVAVLLACGAASVVVPVGFADASLGDVVESFGVHRWYYRQHPWYDEFVHWNALLAQSDQGAWGKRLPVLMTVAVLGVVLVGLARRSTGVLARFTTSTALVTAIGFVSLAATPTKWVNHFGAMAAPATLLLALALIRTPVPRRAGWRVLVPAAVIVGAAAAISFAGPNLWRPFADWGMPFGNHSAITTPYEIERTTPGLGPLDLRNPVLWILVALVGVWWARRRARPALTPDRTLLGVALAGGLALLLLVFVAAPLKQAPGASVASMNLAALRGDPCGLANAVRVLAPSTPLGAPTSAPVLVGDMRAGVPAERDAPGAGGEVWNTDVSGPGLGTLTTGWYPLPAGASTVVVPATGDLRAGQKIAVEVGAGDPAQPIGVRTVELDPFTDKQAGWVDERVDLAAAGVAAPTAVRLVVQDALGGADTWLAVGAPYLAAPVSVPQLVGDAPVFADQVSAVLWPCVDQITIADGLVQAPEYRLRAGDGLEDAIRDNSVFVPNGGTLAAIDRTARFVELPSSLQPPGGVAQLGWGHVERVVYDHPPGDFDLSVGTVERQGWTRLPTLVGEDYTGRGFIG